MKVKYIVQDSACSVWRVAGWGVGAGPPKVWSTQFKIFESKTTCFSMLLDSVSLILFSYFYF